MRFLFLLLPLALLLVCCNSQPLEDYREEGNGLIRSITETLKPIHTREDLIKASPRLKNLFLDLAFVAIAAHQYAYQHPEAEKPDLSPVDHSLSDELREELNRVCHIEGGREILEKCQEEALNKIDEKVIKAVNVHCPSCP